jgi:uncharacterized protein (TIGR02145 family)
MKKKQLIGFHLVVISVLISLLIAGCKKDGDDNDTDPKTVTDADGNVYNIISIGTQKWFKENLKTTKLSDGTVIPLVTDNTEWRDLTTPGFCWFENNQASYKDLYGGYYNWFAVNTNKLCPVGWHVPTDAEWTVLNDYLGGQYVAGGKMKEEGSSHWMSPNTGATNESDFTALPGGMRIWDGGFDYSKMFAYWWSSTESTLELAWYRSIQHDWGNLNRGAPDKTCGLNIRCIKD